MTSPGNPRRRAGKVALILVVLVFLVSRLYVLAAYPLGSDVPIYAFYALQNQVASHHGISLFAYRAQKLQQDTEKAKAAGQPAPDASDEATQVEYPPLALAFLWLPTLGLGDLPTDSAFWASAQVKYFSPYRIVLSARLEQYLWYYRFVLLIVDLLLFGLLWAALPPLGPGEGRFDRVERLTVYLACNLALWPFLYGRLDLVLALLVLVAWRVLVSRASFFWAFTLLALAVNFKVVPLVLVPVWVVGSLPAEREWWRSSVRVGASLAGRTALLLGLIVAIFLPFLQFLGPDALGFLAYHRERGLEVLSVYSLLLMGLHFLGLPITITRSFKSLGLQSALSPLLVSLSPWLEAGLLLGATGLLLVHFRRLAEKTPEAPPPRATLAQTYPNTLLCYTLLFLMLFMAFNKVFSPQYLLWVAPLVYLVPFPRRGRRWFAAGFLLVSILSTILFPYLFWSDVAIPVGLPTRIGKGGLIFLEEEHPLRFLGPSLRGFFLLAARNLLFLGLTGILGRYLVRQALATGDSSSVVQPADQLQLAEGL